MLKGVHLTLMMGPLVPVPVPQSVLDALTSVTVTTNDVGKSGFQLTFTLSKRSPLHTLFLVTGGSPIPVLRVVIVVTLNGTPNVLMDGMVTNHQISPGADAGHATLTLTGEDLTVMMDKVDFSGFPYPAVPMEGRVALILLKYAFLGIIPMIIPSVLIDVIIPTTQIPSHKGTDLQYINRLAARVGYVFYLEPGPVPGMNKAYWGPQIKIGIPQPALNINMDAHTNVESLSFTFDNNQHGIPTVYIYNEQTKVPLVIPLPPITPLNPPLGLIPPIPTHLTPVSDNLAKRTPAQAIMIGLAKAAKMAEAVKGEGSLDVLRYGRILKARQLVGVRGAGPAFDGLHYVTSVTHTIKRGEYKQSFKLSRNGLISTIPKVIP
ncbi:MAG: hypothetical protein ICV60_12885 [Pyrinomonadaceae bacterium]|nr:hypothetical protein [Pyrinomonadaceae bacterium]